MSELLAEELQKAISNHSEAKFMLNEATSDLTRVAEKCLDLDLRTCIKEGLVRFNFPVHPGFKRAVIDGKI